MVRKYYNSITNQLSIILSEMIQLKISSKETKKFNKEGANYFVYILKQDSIFDFVKRYICKVNTSNVNDILSEILSQCESKQTLNNRLVCWSVNISAIEEYSYFSAEGKYQRMKAGGKKGGERVDVGKFDSFLYLEAFKKFTLQFNDIIYVPKLTSIDSMLKIIDLALEIDPHLIVY